MREITRDVHARVGCASDLSSAQRRLIGAALKARKNAYAPYSHYLVGAAVLSTSGKIYIGCNVERASYTQTSHAEQNAIDTMVAAEGKDGRVSSVAVVAAPESATMALRDPSLPKMDKMRKVPSSKMRKELDGILDTKESVVVTRYGKPVCLALNMEDFRSVQAVRRALSAAAGELSLSDVPAPCGNCLQDLVEHATGPDMEILILSAHGEVFVTTLGDVLPMPFKL